MPRRQLKRAITVALLAIVALVVAAPSYAVLNAPTPTTTSIGAPVPAFSWTAVGGAASYELQLTTSGFNPPQYTISTKNTFATMKQTIADGSWLWRVRALDAGGNPGAWSSIESWDKVSGAPTPTQPLQGDSVTYPSPVVFRWDVLDGAARYNVRYGDDPTLTGATEITTTATFYSPPAWLKPGDHYWAVQGIDARGNETAYSEPQLFTWVWPSTVTGLDVTDGVDGSGDANADDVLFEPVLSWSPVGGAVKYQVEVNTDSNWSAGSIKYSKDTVSTSISPNKLLVNGAYYWRVRAVDASDYAGDWSYGGDQPTPGDTFDQTFDAALPTIPSLRMRDRLSDPGIDADGAAAGYQTQVPMISWDPVPGASFYEVQIQSYVDGVGCDWTASLKWDIDTRGTNWTPFAAAVAKLAGVSPAPANDGLISDKLVAGTRYCARVRPQRDGVVTASWAYVDDVDPATDWGFQFTSHVAGSPCSPECELGFLGDDDYVEPATGTISPRLPLFVWNPIEDAQSYHVLISTDPTFATGVIDYGIVRVPAYAPRGMGTDSLPDYTTPLYWKVIPSPNTNGSGVTVDVRNGAYDSFFKQTDPTALLAPADAATVTGHPTFSWVPTEGAYQYRLEVAYSPTFSTSSLVDTATTFATSYTSETKSYPIDKGTLYWRVRAIDKVTNDLAWSGTRSFTQTYDAPAFTGYPNPESGALIPLWEWDPVTNAISYDIDLLCSGSSTSCTDGNGLETTAAPLVKLTGLGMIQWRVRANFATSVGVVHGPWSDYQSFERTIPAPTGVTTQTGAKAVLFSWDPRQGAKTYKVEVSRSAAFASTFETATTENTSYAPTLTNTDYLNGGVFYWRVSTVDADGNQGQWSPAQQASQPAKITVSASPSLIRKRVFTTVIVTVKDYAGKSVAGAGVHVKGAGVAQATKSTGTLGRASFKLKPTVTGKITFTVSKAGYVTTLKQISSY